MWCLLGDDKAQINSTRFFIELVAEKYHYADKAQINSTRFFI